MSKNPKRSNNILLPGLEEFDNAMIGNFENDPSLESELMAILGGGGISKPAKSKPPKRDFKAIDIDKNLLNLDIKEDEEVGEFDENDPELLAELNGMLDEDEEDEVPPVNAPKSPANKTSSSENVKTLENLKQLYQAAIKDAQATNDSGKARRYERQQKLIEDLLRKAMKGEHVEASEFPPPVYVKNSTLTAEKPANAAPSPPKRTAPMKTEDKLVTSSREPVAAQSPGDKVLDALIRRQLEYKSAAVGARTKDLELAKGLMIVVKQFDQVIEEVKNGVVFDLENLPPPPSQFKLSDLNQDDHEEGEEAPVQVARQDPGTKKTFPEELSARRDFYKSSVEKAKTENNGGKVRRLMRVVQQYDEALVAYGKKTVYPYEELPPPPGMGPLSRPGPTAAVPAAQARGPPLPATTTTAAAVAVAPSGQRPANKTIQYLLQRQGQFKAAALKAKNDGDLPLAKELLRQSKGFDQMIQASESGLPVDLSRIPSLPTETDFNFELVTVDECQMPDDMKCDDRDTLFGRLQSALIDQIKSCRTYQQSVMKTGDVIGAKRFETLAASAEKDLHGLQCLMAGHKDLPRFHYEYKMFAVVAGNMDLGESDLEVEVVRATDLAIPAGLTGPDQLDTYIVLELPFPTDHGQSFTTETVRRTNSPVYNSVTKFQVNTKSRVFQRVVKSKNLKADIFYRKGFLQKDRLLGTSTIKLEKLDRSCTVHECYDIMENRKVIGGKLEVKLRLRTAVGGPQTDNVKEKWLVIDDFNKNYEKAAAFDQMAAVAPVEDVGSIDVLKYEVSEFRKKLAEVGPTTGAGASLAASVRQRIREKEEAIKTQESRLRSENEAVRVSYIQYLAKMPQQYTVEAKKFLAAGNRDKAQSLMTKKKIVENELERLRQKK